MRSLFNLFKKKSNDSISYIPPVALPLEELIKNNTDPYERFDDVLQNSDAGQQLKQLYTRLDANEVIEDSEVIEPFNRFATKQQSNAIYVAELFLVTIAPLCYHRPEVSDKLLYLPLQALYWGNGATTHTELMDFVKEHLMEYKLTPYGGLPDEKGMQWLRDVLPTLTDMTNRVFAQVIKDNDQD